LDSKDFFIEAAKEKTEISSPVSPDGIDLVGFIRAHVSGCLPELLRDERNLW
jgi:hypothetical protein